MARKPNFDFERRQREKAKAAKTADKAQAKKQKAQENPSDGHAPAERQPENDA